LKQFDAEEGQEISVEQLKDEITKHQELEKKILEEIPDSLVFLLQFIDECDIPAVGHYVHQLMMSNQVVDFETILKYAQALMKSEKNRNAVRLIASVLCFALQHGYEPLSLIALKHEYNERRYPPSAFNNGLSEQEARAKCKLIERQTKMKEKVLYLWLREAASKFSTNRKEKSYAQTAPPIVSYEVLKGFVFHYKETYKVHRN
jgi:hypothetical protein